MKLILASNNKIKLEEFKSILEPHGFEIITPDYLGIHSDPEENGSTYEENARIKATAVWNKVHKPVIADDSGLEIDALDGKPGLYTARFAEPGTHAEKILEMMKDQPNRNAKLICSLCYIDEKGKSFTVRSSCIGTIPYTIRGDHPTYCYNILMRGDKSLAELSDSERNKVTHRARALDCFVDTLWLD